MSGRHRDRLAIDGATAFRSEPFPEWPVSGPEEERSLLDLLHNDKWGIGSGRIAEFETKFAAFQNADHCVAVTNGTVAIEMALRATGITYGDEVIVPPYTFVATASAVLTVGGIPVFADIQPDTWLIDPEQIEAMVSARTKAIIPVHLAGCPADLDAINDIAVRHELRVIEDAAQAHGASWRGRRVGAIGDLGTFSFQSSKNVTCGEGGAIVGDDAELMEAVWSYHNCGRAREGGWYQHEVLGTNARMSGWQAAVLLAQLTRAEEQLVRRQANARILTSMLEEIPGIEPLRRDDRVTDHAYHLFCLRYDRRAFGGRSKKDFLEALRAEGIPCSPGYVPLYRMPAIVNASKAIAALVGADVTAADTNAERCSITERAWAEEAVWLRQSVLLGTEADMASIASAIKKIQITWD